MKIIQYPEIKIPKNIKETKYPGYYVSEEGEVYRKPITNYNESHKLNEYGLIKMSYSYRGHTKNLKYQYKCVNVSIKDEKGKTIKQIKKSIHQLVTETFIPNPNNYTEIDHIDHNNRNNHVSNLRWCDRLTNMEWSSKKNGKYFKLIDTITNKTYEGINLQNFVRENWEWISQRTNTSNVRRFTQKLILYSKKSNPQVNGLILKK